MGTADGIKRAERVASRIRTELMDLILRGQVSDPAAAGTYISNVALSADLRHARVYVRLLDDAASEQRREQAVRALQRAGGHIRRALASRLKLKYQPELKFYWDEGVDAQQRIESVLDELRRDGSLP